MPEIRWNWFFLVLKEKKNRTDIPENLLAVSQQGATEEAIRDRRE